MDLWIQSGSHNTFPADMNKRKASIQAVWGSCMDIRFVVVWAGGLFGAHYIYILESLQPPKNQFWLITCPINI